MSAKRLPEGFNTADENDIIQAGPNGVWYSRGAAEIVLPNVVVSVNDSYVMPSRLSSVVTIEVDTLAMSWSSDTITLSADARPGDIVRVVDVSGNTGSNVGIVVLPGGSASIDGRPNFNLDTPFATAVFYRKSNGHWAVLSEGLNYHTLESLNSPGVAGGNGAYSIGTDHLVRVTTSPTSWPATGGTVTLPTNTRRGTRITVTDLQGNAAMKEILVSAGDGQIDGVSGGVLRFSNPFGSVTLENMATSLWRIISGTAKYYVSVTGSTTLQGQEFWHAIPVTVFITGGFGSVGTITIPNGAHIGAEVELMNVAGIPGDNIRFAATGGVINDNGSLSFNDFLSQLGIYHVVRLKKRAEGTNDWLIASRANTVAV